MKIVIDKRKIIQWHVTQYVSWESHNSKTLLSILHSSKIPDYKKILYLTRKIPTLIMINLPSHNQAQTNLWPLLLLSKPLIPYASPRAR